jgi:hypothetical protein
MRWSREHRFNAAMTIGFFLTVFVGFARWAAGLFG